MIKSRIDIEKINKLTDKLKNKLGNNINEEQTKNSFVMPFFMALGYDIFDSDEFVPEYTADFGTKRGEKVDYAICLNGQPIILIEVKKLNTQLSTEHVSQLFRYYSSTDAKVGILTNGDDFWFFTDSVKKNQMDQEPYLKIKLSNFNEKSARAIECYCRENIDTTDISEDVQIQRFRVQVYDFIDKLKCGNIPTDFIDYLCNKSNVKGIEKSKLAVVFNDEYTKALEECTMAKSNKQPDIIQIQENESEKDTDDSEVKKKYNWNRDKIEDLPIGQPLGYNKHNWTFHKPEKVLYKDKEFSVNTFKDVMLTVIGEIMMEYGDNAVLQSLKAKPYALDIYEDEQQDKRAIEKIPKTKYYISTSFSANAMMIYIQ